MDQRCETCRYWVYTYPSPDDRPDTLGACRRMPPQNAIIRDESDRIRARSLFPILSSSDWCGEYQPPHK